MKKKFLRIASTAIGLTLAAGLVCGMLSACGGDGGEKPLVLSMDQPDGVFNPFFYTSGTDGDVVGQTMIGMLSTDKSGEIVSGADEPCVALAHSVVTTGTSQDISGDTDKDSSYANYYTDYYFAVKDDIHFSDGTPLTIKDVLFNIYMYLDPAYTGSATMYSVKIKGLKAYRTQQEDENQQEGFENELNLFAETRINQLRTWAEEDNSTLADLERDYPDSRADLDKIDGFFKEELESDWNTAMNADLKEYDKYVDAQGEKIFTETWQVFLYNYGVISLKSETNADKSQRWYTATHNYDKNIEKTKEALTNYVFNTMLGGKNSASDAYKQNLVAIITQYATANTFRQYLHSVAIKEILGGDMNVRSVSGITTTKGDSIPAADGSTIQLGKQYDILKIRINGEDPKAIQNFGFTVAPMDYYTAPWRKDHQVKEFSTEEGKEYYGVEFGNTEFMDSIRYIQVPMGAGPYRASTENGTEPSEIANIQKTQFFSDNIVYLESNEQFFLGAPKIKMLRFKVISTSLLYDAVKNGEVNYASPSGTSEMIRNLENTDRAVLDYTLTDNLGYGYIGVNATYVQDLNIRRAIMSAMDTGLCIDYYGGGTLASPIYRPMSKVIDWCYPSEITEAYYPYDATGAKSRGYAELAGYRDFDSDGFRVNSDGERLKFTFTIAGDSVDHPAYSCMNNAARVLNEIGFDITVTRDSTALSKLAAGRLQVWAAAWSSSSDPDMYQVYHKDSTATSILAWGFPWIETDGTTEEKELLNDLADRIEEGRETTVRSERKKIYAGHPDDGGKCALDLVMELAVELPTYQRKALYVYQRGLFSDASISKFFGDNATAFASPLNRIWELEFAE